LETTDFHGGNRCKTDVDVQKPVTQWFGPEFSAEGIYVP
jgi:hypothetical protein